MKLDKSFLIKAVAFATAFTVLYQAVKDLGEIAIYIYHYVGIIISGIIGMSLRKKD